MFKFFTILSFSLICIILMNLTPVIAQDNELYGSILSITEKSVNVHFENRIVGVGEMIDFWRFTKIIDPITGDVRGETKGLVAKGVVDDIGIGKVKVTLTELISDQIIQMSDKALPTGRGKRIIRTQKFGEIQELLDDGNIVIDLGISDDISEGDEFLIQRVEKTFDPETKKLTITNQIDIGRGKVESVDQNTSVGTLVELIPGMELLETDNVVFSMTSEVDEVPAIHDSAAIDSLKTEINELKREVGLLRTAVDSLGNEHLLFKSEIETVLSKLMSGDISGTKIIMKNEEPFSRSSSASLFDDYKQALKLCLDHKFKSALSRFQAILKQYPNSKLTENCRYWIAQSQFTMGNYTTAAEGFKTVVGDRRFKQKDDDASIMLGITYFKLGNVQEALTEFENFIQRYPKSEYIHIVNRWKTMLSS